MDVACAVLAQYQLLDNQPLAHQEAYLGLELPYKSATSPGDQDLDKPSAVKAAGSE